ncbi:unnamed protein product [Adineta steineri]|uniref:Uncharacterized protein n=1 Tax=Adineta steineri TaxID=433720 RepID=A0A819NJ59_9BILA|nr:unnamed protein product [Adineta steineri]
MVDLSSAIPVATEPITTGSIEIPSCNEGESGVFTTANTKAAKSWSSVTVSWEPSKKDLVLVIETPFTARQQPFLVAMVISEELRDLHFFQLVDGEEVEGNVKDMSEREKLIRMDSDSNYQVILKVSNTSTTSADRIYFVYHVGELNKD